MKLTVKDILIIPHRELRNAGKQERISITGVSTDTRTLKRGNLFFAIRGEQLDGHDFLDRAREAGASAAVVDIAASPPPDTLPLLVVEDTVKALGDLARWYRLKFRIPVLAVAGSNGKTTTKEMIARVLGAKYAVLATEGNLNNHIGVPLTLFRLERRHQIAVVEIGTNHPGEIEYLCGILQPTHGLITNIGREHLEFFGDVEGVAKEEGMVFESLRERRHGVALVNADDARVARIGRKVRRRVTYGFAAARVDIRGRLIGLTESGCVRISATRGNSKRTLEARLKIPGRHNAINALSAVAAGMTFGVPHEGIRRAIESFRPASKRMETVRVGGALIINDTYNANPDSMIEALRTLAGMRVTGKRIAVLADMLELGQRSIEQHERVGREVAELGIEYLLTYGTMARHINKSAALPLGMHYDQKNVLAEYLTALAGPGDAVLVKGSRGMKMEDVVTFLVERERAAHKVRG